MKNAYSQNLLSDFIQSEESRLKEEVEMARNNVGPSEMTIQKILGFSKAYSVSSSKILGKIELLDN